MDRSKFTRKEAVDRAKFEYGLYPYEPDRPCKIMSATVAYKCCECGFETNSARAIFDHTQGKSCGVIKTPKQQMLF